MFEKILKNIAADYLKLTKSDSIKVQDQWRDIFASKVKETTGKWKIGRSYWMGFAERIEPSFHNTKAIFEYEKQQIEPCYIFDESGKHCFFCKPKKLITFYNFGYDVYIVPESFLWTIVFQHENAIYFAYNNQKVDIKK